MKFIFGAGGTGGHITPALALADELQKYNHDILFIGNRNSIEESLCKSAGYPIRYIKVQKLYRSFKLENLVFPFFLASSIIAAINILKEGFKNISGESLDYKRGDFINEFNFVEGMNDFIETLTFL